MSNDKKTTALAVNGIDLKDTISILAKLDEQLSQLKKIEETPYKAGTNLEGFGDVRVEQKIENLGRAFSMVRGKNDAYVNAMEELGETEYPVFTISGGTVEDWKHDIKLRLQITKQEVRSKALKEAKDKISKFMSEEEQKKSILMELGKLLS